MSLPLSPPEWFYSRIPLSADGEEIVRLDEVIATLHALADQATESDTGPLGIPQHVAHLLKAEQGPDGGWPAVLNARTGQAISEERTLAPLSLFRRLDALFNLCEFESACLFAEEGVLYQTAETRRNIASDSEPDED